MGIKMVRRDSIEFKPIADYISNVDKSTSRDQWGMVFTSKDGVDFTLMIEKLFFMNGTGMAEECMIGQQVAHK